MSVQLTPEHIAALRDLETLHNHIHDEIERAKSAGLDMTPLEDALAQNESIRQGLLKVYAGTRRRKTVG
jgi:hypothetical protein